MYRTIMNKPYYVIEGQFQADQFRVHSKHWANVQTQVEANKQAERMAKYFQGHSVYGKFIKSIVKEIV